MFRTLFRRGVPVLALTLLLLGAVPAAAQPSFLMDRWDGIWSWVVSFWSDGETGEEDRGLGADPDGLASGGGDRGPEADPNGSTNEGDRGAGADPNG